MLKKLPNTLTLLLFGFSGALMAQTTIVQDATGVFTTAVRQRTEVNTNQPVNQRQGQHQHVSSGCPVITCPSNIVTYSDNGCGSVVTFNSPTATDPCSVESDTFSFSGVIQNWTVPAGVTSVRIEARGAQGGNSGSSTVAPGLGAIMSGDFTVTPGQQLRILVGQNNNSGNGGGGGTFVTDITNNPLIVAGGGGGGGAANDSPSKHGQVGTSGGNGSGGGGNGGVGGNGGSIGASFASGAGGGLLTDGADGWTANTGGDAFINGGAGANVGFGVGGFGGGGNGSGYVVGAGGGGYSGGGSGSNSIGGGGVGGGGGSFNSGTNQLNTGGANSGNGLVIISYSSGSGITLTQLAGLTSGSYFPVGITTQTFVASDGLGNNDTCSFTVTVLDTLTPVFVCPSNITVATDSGMCSATVSFAAPAATDNCSVAGTTQTAGPASGSAFPVGTTTVTFTAVDPSGNTSVCSFDVIVTDGEAPVFNCPQDLLVNADSGSCGAVVNFTTPAAADNCNVSSVNQTVGSASGSFFPTGITTITFEAADSAGNITSCSFNIVVTDAEAPVISCPSDITVNSDSGLCTSVVNFNTPNATDNCGSVTITQTGGPVSGSAFPTGTTTVTFTAADTAGNITVCSFNVIVLDIEAPALVCGSNISVCEGVETSFSAAASDICSGVASLTYTMTGATTGSGSGNGTSSFNTGITTITYTAADSSGNSTSCSFTVTATALPVVSLNASATTVCADDGLVTLTGSPAGGSWSGTGVTGSTFSPAVAGNGVHTLTYSYTDTAGCTGIGNVAITVNPCTGVNETADLSDMQVVPNPSNGAVQILLGSTYTEVRVSITNLNGQQIFFSEFSNSSSVNLNVESVASGVYLLKVETEKEARIVKMIRE